MGKSRLKIPPYELPVLSVEQQHSSLGRAFSRIIPVIKSPTFKQSFFEKDNPSDCIKLVLSDLAVSTFLTNFDKNPQDDKNEAKAIEFVKNGNDAFKAGRYENALKSYSNAIRYSYCFGDLPPIAFGNRSAAFFMLKQYEAALKDIDAVDAAEAYAYRQCKRFFMLTIRKCQCLLRLGRIALAKDVYNTIKRGDLIGDDVDLLTKFEKKEGKHLNVDEKDEEPKKKNIEPKSLKHVTSVIDILSENGRFLPQSSDSQFSSKVKVRYDDMNGRHLVTTKDVHFGDILAVTKPYAAVLTPEQELHLCHHCLTSLEPIPNIYPRTVPCIRCPSVLYCSEDCRDEAWKGYHHSECSLAWSSFEKSIVCNTRTCYYICRRALRTFFVAGGLESIRAVTETLPSASDASKSADFTNDPKDYYQNVYRMEIKKWLSYEEHVMTIIKVACLFKLVKWSQIPLVSSSPIGHQPTNQFVASLSEKDFFAIETLLRHYLHIRSNETLFVRCDQSALDDPSASFEYISTLDPLIGLVEQSCKPNTSIIVVDCARPAPHISNVCVLFAHQSMITGTVLSTVGPDYGDTVKRIILDDFIKSKHKDLSKPTNILCSCEHCKDKRRESPFEPSTTRKDRQDPDGYELVRCGKACDGFIRRTDDGGIVNCCTCKRVIDPDELVNLKKISLEILEFYTLANDLVVVILNLIEKEADVPKLYDYLLVLETLITHQNSELALEHSRILLVDLYRRLTTFYLYCHKKNKDKVEHFLNAWKYAEKLHSTLKTHFGGGDSLGLMLQLEENVGLFSEAKDLLQTKLDDPVKLSSLLGLDENLGLEQDMLHSFVTNYGNSRDELGKMKERFEMI